ncbi:MAG TPA: TetR/AcrR family transcriptional regulator [bacterium]|nr:TetR/AcrR family transcriptional regulator [bacterium]
MDFPPKEKRDQRRERGCQTRQRIIDTAAAIIIEEGRPGLTTRAICEKAGIGKGSLYHHFTDTHELVIEIVNHFMDHYFGAMTAQEFESVDDFFLKFGHQAIAQISTSYKIRERFMPFVVEMVEDEHFIAETMEKNGAMQRALIGKLSALAGGTVPPAVLADAVLALFTLLEGTESLMQFTRDEKRFLAMWERVAKLLADHVKQNTIRSKK